MLRSPLCVMLAAWLFIAAPVDAQDKRPGKKPDGNRLAYLDEVNPYYPHKDFAKLITPQWVGEDGVEAVVILAIDDMKDRKKYEAFLRPILNRLKKIDGRAPVSIMTCSVDPKDAQLQSWLKEGLSLECHTIDNPCPFFAKGFAKAKETYDKCVDLLHEVPNSKPVAFRMPCCDAMNTPSPRFYAEIFNKVTDKKNFLSIDSSVFNVFTSADPELPKELVLDDKGNERFKPYLPADRSFVNTIENYPYPYVIGRLCWQFPCMTPSDWQAKHRHQANNPQTIADWKAALDCTVIKKGVFSMVFHPHGWIKNDQIVEFIDHAVAKHGKKVKFLTFKEALERLGATFNSLRQPSGEDYGKRVLDLNNDGYMDVVAGFQAIYSQPHTWTMLWLANETKWGAKKFFKYPTMITFDGSTTTDVGYRWGVFHADGRPTYAFATASQSFLEAGSFDGQKWVREKELAEGQKLIVDTKKFRAEGFAYRDRGNRFRDIDGDGNCELVVANPWQSALFSWSTKKNEWIKAPFQLPAGAVVANSEGNDNGLRFMDLDGDSKLDLIFSNEKEYGVYLFTDMEKGWSKKIMAGKRGDKDALPMISRNGTDNGFWVHSGHLWWSNEDTATMKDHVDRRKISDLLGVK